ncbi:MAG: hypothetical protein QOF91_3435, partial [Alphaproteobacteria bacterium]|nr:hypothetical protein [Alphaproteobacteria bacterium]
MSKSIHRRRREFIAALGSAALVGPRGAWGQQPIRPVIAFVRSTPLAAAKHLIAAFREGLAEGGVVEGRNATVEYYSAEGQTDRATTLIADLVQRPVDVIAANGIAALVAKAATTRIPIVFATGGDAVEQGLVDRLNRPGSNVTGVNFFDGAVGAKRLELLRQLVPKVSPIGVLVNPRTTETELERAALPARSARCLNVCRQAWLGCSSLSSMRKPRTHAA